MKARRLGAEPEDLEIDLERDDRPASVVRLLGACLRDDGGRPFPEPEIWSWSLPRRTRALALTAEASSAAAWTFRRRCPRAGCREELEIELEPEAILREIPEEMPLECFADGTTRLSLRLPRGDDQRAWLACMPIPPDELGVRLASTLVTAVDGEPPPPGFRIAAEWAGPIAERLAAADPWTDALLEAACPACGVTATFRFDLERHLLDGLAGAGRRLLDDVHVLAARYHWAEAAILALPPRRRAAYLERISREDLG